MRMSARRSGSREPMICSHCSPNRTMASRIRQTVQGLNSIIRGRFWGKQGVFLSVEPGQQPSERTILTTQTSGAAQMCLSRRSKLNFHWPRKDVVLGPNVKRSISATTVPARTEKSRHGLCPLSQRCIQNMASLARPAVRGDRRTAHREDGRKQQCWAT